MATLARLFVLLLFAALYHAAFSPMSFAEERTVITSDSLEYNASDTTYTAKGAVTITKGDTTLHADEIRYREETSEAIATGNVSLGSPDASINASGAYLNMETETGLLYDADIFFAKGNYRIYGGMIEKKGEDYYFSPEAVMTTCDGSRPPWSIKGRNVHARVGDILTAKHVSFRLKGIPFLYSPLFGAPILSERKTGLLFPDVGFSKSRGMHLRTPLFLVLDENMDMTLIPEWYSKRGVGGGVEYRYLFPGISGKWWLYDLRDRELKKNFFELTALHDQRSPDKAGGFLSINYVNEPDFYREFTNDIQIRSNRFLESTGEVSIPFSNSRAYLLSQYWIDLKNDTEDPLQRLPEVGYVINPRKIGPVWFSQRTAFSNFWREEGLRGARFDIFPQVSHSFGEKMIVMQTLGLRETAYALDGEESDSFHREALVYDISSRTRLLKKYRSFTHIIEPIVGYSFVSKNEESPVLFDSADLLENTSVAEIALLNRLFDGSGEFLVLKASQGYDLRGGDRAFLPFRIQAALKKPLLLRLDTSYNVQTGKLETANSDVGLNLFGITLSTGQRYNRKEDIETYVAGVGIHPLQPVYLDWRIWYDAEEKETKEISLIMRYLSQCWGVSIGFVKRPGDYSINFLFELKGITRALKM